MVMRNNLFKYPFTVVFLLMAVVIFGQDAGEATTQSPNATAMTWFLENIVLIVAGLVIVGAFMALFYMNNMLLQTQKIRLLQEHGIEVLEEVKLIDQKSTWQKLMDLAGARVPMEKEKDILMDHNYDGIRELDNVLPPWWVGMFYVTIVFGVLYIGYQHFSDNGISSAQEYEMAMEDAKKEVRAYLAKQSDAVDETSVTLLTDETDLGIGASIFQTKCTPCHGQYGEGNSIGPNLTDKYWLHGGGIKNVFTTIKYGVPEKGMISWKSQIRASDMQKVASYILSLQGSNPPNAKDPQGDLWEGTEEKQDKGDELSLK